MKKITFFVFTHFAIFTCAAQTKFYTGEWTVKNTTDHFTCVCKIDIQDNGSAKAEFIWKFESINKDNAELVEYYKGKSGLKGTEITSGVYKPGTKDLLLTTDHLVDPNVILGTSVYNLKFTTGKKIVYGVTVDINGNTTGFFQATEAANFTEKEFIALKNTIK